MNSTEPFDSGLYLSTLASREIDDVSFGEVWFVLAYTNHSASVYSRDFEMSMNDIRSAV